MADRLAELFERSRARLFRLALRMSRDREEALDLVQEVFVRAAQRIERIPGDAAHAEAWLARTLVNLCRDRWRRSRVRGRTLPLAGCEPAAPPPEERLAAQAQVREALALLAPRTRAVVVLHVFDEASHAEIARELGMAQATVRWHLHSGLRQLRRALASAEPRRSPCLRVLP
ncbi:MAG: sigma-70 family RNA polymerase sigma factor [Acidobacteria bacterium]|nr:sigma-70 family RNA polymerase sigma factor [Acidobacteriota bacterium]